MGLQLIWGIWGLVSGTPILRTLCCLGFLVADKGVEKYIRLLALSLMILGLNSVSASCKQFQPLEKSGHMFVSLSALTLPVCSSALALKDAENHGPHALARPCLAAILLKASLNPDEF